MKLKPHIRFVEAVPRRSVPREVPPGYSDPSFWKAFATIYWPDLNAPDLQRFVRSLTEEHMAARPDEPLRVLALGFGLGAFELPILHHIQSITGRRIEFYGIDFSRFPLELAGKFIHEHWGNLPMESGGMAPLLQHSGADWKAPTFAKREPSPENADSFTLIHDDLDYEPHNPAISGEIRLHRPSDWNLRLRKLIGPVVRFDLILSSFCFFHLDWWRPALLRALTLLRPGGLFLHSKADGDEHLFEGRPGAHGNENNSKVAQAVFLSGLAGDPRVREILTKPRSASATRPHEIELFVDRLKGFGVSLPTPLCPDYILQPTVTRDHYLAMLRSRGFSTFRIVEEALGNANEYKDLLKNIASSTEYLRDTSDLLRIGADWTVLRMDSQRVLRRFPLLQRLTRSTSRSSPPKGHAEKSALASAFRRDYESTGVASTPQFSGESAERSIALARHISTSCLLHEHCLAAELAFYDPVEGKAKWQYFSNPLFDDAKSNLHSLKFMHAYLAVLAARNDRFPRFSNTKLLMEEILPRSPRPCVFSYFWTPSIEAKINIEEDPDFTHIRFLLPTPSSTINEGFNRLAGKAWALFPPTVPLHTEAGGPNDDVPISNQPFTLERNNWTTQDLPHLQGLVSSIWPDAELQRCADELIASLSATSESGHGRSPVATALYEILKNQDIGLAVAQTLLALAPFQGESQLVIFPSTYRLDERYTADSCILFLYSNPLSREDLATEFHKVTTLFQKAIVTAAARDQRYDFAHTIAGPLWSIKRDPQFHNLGLSAKVAITKIDSYINLWNQSSLTPSNLPQEINIQSLVAEARADAMWKLRTRLPQKRSIQKGLPDGQEDLVRKMLEEWTLSPRSFESFIGSYWTLEDHIGGTFTTRWPTLLPCLLHIVLIGFFQHVAVSIAIGKVTSGVDGQKTERVGTISIDENANGGITFAAKNTSSTYFSPAATTEARVINSLTRLTHHDPEHRLEYEWRLERSRDRSLWLSRLSLNDPTAATS